MARAAPLGSTEGDQMEVSLERELVLLSTESGSQGQTGQALARLSLLFNVLDLHRLGKPRRELCFFNPALRGPLN